MKKLIVFFCLLMPMSMWAQLLGNHHIEIGTGVAIPKEMFFENPFTEATSVAAYGEYRYNLSQNFAIGAVYSFVIPHTSKGETLTIKTSFHTLNAIVEYTVARFGASSLFIGGGLGGQLRNVAYEVETDTDTMFWSTDISVHAGLEFFKHLRVTVGHYHDLHYPISFLPSGAPYYHLSIGWSF